MRFIHRVYDAVTFAERKTVDVDPSAVRVNVDVLLCADAVHRRAGRGRPAAHRRGEVAPPGGGERTEHPEGGQTHVQRCRTVTDTCCTSVSFHPFLGYVFSSPSFPHNSSSPLL